ncbi:MAG: hypothetical protein ACRCY8_19235 [Dermatophilaceae bacterium]
MVTVRQLAPVEGDPDGIRLLARTLEWGGQRLGATAAVLARLRDGAVWDSPAGTAFGAQLQQYPRLLDRVATRQVEAVAALRELARVLENVQRVVSPLVIQHREARERYAALEERIVVALSQGGTESTPPVAGLRLEQQDCMRAWSGAEARHASELDWLALAHRRCAAVLRRLADDEISDSVLYRGIVGVGSVGENLAAVPGWARRTPVLTALATAGDLMVVTSDGLLLVGYGEGSWLELGTTAGIAGTGLVGEVFKKGATHGAELTKDGVTVTRRLSTQERVAFGAVAAARGRVDDLRARFTLRPPEVTARAFSAGPPPLKPSGPWLARQVAVARTLPARARARVRAEVDERFLNDWRLATANGPQARRLYASGVTLDLTARAVPVAERVVSQVAPGADADPRPQRPVPQPAPRPAPTPPAG